MFMHSLLLCSPLWIHSLHGYPLLLLHLFWKPYYVLILMQSIAVLSSVPVFTYPIDIAVVSLVPHSSDMSPVPLSCLPPVHPHPLPQLLLGTLSSTYSCHCLILVFSPMPPLTITTFLVGEKYHLSVAISWLATSHPPAFVLVVFICVFPKSHHVLHSMLLVIHKLFLLWWILVLQCVSVLTRMISSCIPVVRSESRISLKPIKLKVKV